MIFLNYFLNKKSKMSMPNDIFCEFRLFSADNEGENGRPDSEKVDADPREREYKFNKNFTFKYKKNEKDFYYTQGYFFQLNYKDNPTVSLKMYDQDFNIISERDLISIKEIKEKYQNLNQGNNVTFVLYSLNNYNHLEKRLSFSCLYVEEILKPPINYEFIYDLNKNELVNEKTVIYKNYDMYGDLPIIQNLYFNNRTRFFFTAKEGDDRYIFRNGKLVLKYNEKKLGNFGGNKSIFSDTNNDLVYMNLGYKEKSEDPAYKLVHYILEEWTDRKNVYFSFKCKKLVFDIMCIKYKLDKDPDSKLKLDIILLLKVFNYLFNTFYIKE